MEELVVRLLDHWCLLSTYYVLSALTHFRTILWKSAEIYWPLDILAGPVLGPEDGKLFSGILSPNVEERFVKCFTPQIGLSGGLIYLLSSHPPQLWAIHQELGFLGCGGVRVIHGLWKYLESTPLSQFSQTPRNRLHIAWAIYSIMNLFYSGSVWALRPPAAFLLFYLLLSHSHLCSCSL